MISVLAQERLLGAALGSALVGFVVLEQRKRIYDSIRDEKSQQVYAQSKVKEAIFGKQHCIEFAHIWNKAVDQTFDPLIESLRSRGW